ncbi:TIM barrel protein [Rhodobacter sp. M37P]|uniref:TIM barrel protein n=1 Tax=Rhodobacter calidifons TaxID=2715277 RepID=A0ABX0G3A9_9RHOB|nr:TIM barrel protein [Rhodobacter calidifons]
MEHGLALLAEAGAVAVEPAYIEGYMAFDEDSFRESRAQRLARLIAVSGLTVHAVSAHTDLGSPDSHEKLRRRIGFAAALGARILICNATTADRTQDFRRVVTAVLPDLAAAGLTLALENPGHGSDALIPDGVRGAAVVAAFDSPWVRLNYDIGNALTYGARRASAAEDLRAALPVAAHLHLKDLRDVAGDWVFCPVGQGDVGYGTDVPLAAIPPDVPLGIEHPIRLWRPAHGDPRRREEVPSDSAVVAAVRSSLEWVARSASGDDQGLSTFTRGE